MLAEGVPAPLIEHAALAAGMPVGPLAVLDETSLALSVHVIEQTRADLAAEGRHGRAVGGRSAGRAHGQGAGAPGPRRRRRLLRLPDRAQPKRLWPELTRTVREAGVDAADIDALKQRLLYRQSIETARCLAEGVLTSVAEANIGSIFGIGFPAWTGGAMQFIAVGRPGALPRQRRRAGRAARRAIRASGRRTDGARSPRASA